MIDQQNKIEEVKEGGLRLWCVRLSLDYAKEEVRILEEAVQRLKARANSLIGWAVTLVTALIAVFLHTQYFNFRY